MKIFYYLFWDCYRILLILFTKRILKVSKKESQRRLEICFKCDKINKEGRFLNYIQPRCKICGCYLKLKIRLIAEKCPDEKNKWE